MIRLPDQDLMDIWRRQGTTQEIWQCLKASYDPLPSLLACPAEKVEYFRGQAALLNDLQKIFEIRKEVK